MPVLDKLDKYFMLKLSSVGNPSMYLGTKLKLTVGMFDCWLQGIQPCEYKGMGSNELGNQVFRLAEEEKKKKKK